MKSTQGTAAGVVAPALDLSDEVLNRAEAAALLDINSRTLDDWHARGEGPPVCILGGSRRYLKSSVLSWVKANETAPSDARRVRPGNRKRPPKPAAVDAP